MVPARAAWISKEDRLARVNPNETENLTENVVNLNRVAKVVKGGRRFSFSSVVVVGDGHGRVGAGMGRATEIPESIRKGVEDAKKNMVEVPLYNDTLPHEVTANFGASRVLIKPALPGTGVIAGGGVRAVMEAAGVKDVLTKSLGSNNPVNVVRATIKALLEMQPRTDARASRPQQEVQETQAPESVAEEQDGQQAVATAGTAQVEEPAQAPANNGTAPGEEVANAE